MRAQSDLVFISIVTCTCRDRFTHSDTPRESHTHSLPCLHASVSVHKCEVHPTSSPVWTTSDCSQGGGSIMGLYLGVEPANTCTPSVHLPVSATSAHLEWHVAGPLAPATAASGLLVRVAVPEWPLTPRQGLVSPPLSLTPLPWQPNGQMLHPCLQAGCTSPLHPPGTCAAWLPPPPFPE